MTTLPGFAGHLLLLWKMRLQFAANAKRSARLPPALVQAGALAPGLVLSFLSYSLMVHPAVAGDPIVSRFFLGLLCFVASMVWVTWPILSAGVDDHSELIRYVAFPISRPRLLAASTLAGLLEPLAFVVHGPVLGALLGHAATHGPSVLPLSLLLFAAYLLMCAFWSRVGLYLVLRMLRSNLGAPALGSSLLIVVLIGLLLPPVDTSWLYAEGGGFGAIDRDVLGTAAAAFARVPPGYLAEGLRHLADGRPLLVLIELAGLVGFTILGVVAAGRLLAGTAVVPQAAGSGRKPKRDRFASMRSTFPVLVLREALDLWRNPRARLLVGVPFVLAVLLRLLSARDLFLHFLGHSADAWLMGALSLYAAILLLSTFAQNSFGYDGHGLRLLLASPVSPGLVLRAKNLVHGMAAGSLGAAVCLFYLLYIGRGDVPAVVTVILVLLALVPVGLTAGNFLSIWYPAKFHASLQRRDKAPLISSLSGLVALGLGSSALPLSMMASTGGGPGITGVLTALACALCAWLLYAAMAPVAMAQLGRSRERMLTAITRS